MWGKLCPTNMAYVWACVHGMDADPACVKSWVCSQSLGLIYYLTICSKNCFLFFIFFSNSQKMLVNEWNWTWLNLFHIKGSFHLYLMMVAKSCLSFLSIPWGLVFCFGLFFFVFFTSSVLSKRTQTTMPAWTKPRFEIINLTWSSQK